MEEGAGEINGGQCAVDVLWDCAPETCIILVTGVTPIYSIKRKKINTKEKKKMEVSAFFMKEKILSLSGKPKQAARPFSGGSKLKSQGRKERR